MKIIIAITLALAVLSTTATIQSFLKPKAQLGDGFPEVFSWESHTKAPTGVPANATFRVDGKNNIFSYTVGYINTAFGAYTNETYTWDFQTNTSYIHTTGNGMCMKNSFESPTLNNTIDVFITKVWNKKAVVVKEEKIGDHTYTTINIKYDADNNIDLLNDNNVMVHLNGTMFGRDFQQNITRGITLDSFTKDDHIPASCN